MHGIEATSPHFFRYCMSGALPVPEPGPPISNPFNMPGEWVESPARGSPTSRYPALYDPDSSEMEKDASELDVSEDKTIYNKTLKFEAELESQSSNNAAALPAEIDRDVKLNDITPEATVASVKAGHDANPNEVKSVASTMSDPEDSQSLVDITTETPVEHGVSYETMEDESTASYDEPHLFTLKNYLVKESVDYYNDLLYPHCLRKDTGEFDPTCMEIHQIYHEHFATRSQKPNPLSRKVRFYNNPKTGKPIKQIKKFLADARIDDSYHSTPASVLSSPVMNVADSLLLNKAVSPNTIRLVAESDATNVPANASLDAPMSYPASAEAAEASQSLEAAAPEASPSSQLSSSSLSSNAMQSSQSAAGAQRDDKAPAQLFSSSASSDAMQSSQGSPQVAPFTPVNGLKTQKQSSSLSPSDQLIVEEPDPAIFNLPPLNQAPRPISDSMKIDQVRRVRSTSLRVDSNGSPMRVPTSSTLSMKPVALLPPTADSLSHGRNPSPHNESSSSTTPAGASSPIEQDRISASDQVEVSVAPLSASSPTAGTLSHGRNSSTHNKSSSSTMPAGASSPIEQDSISAPDQVDVSVTPTSVLLSTAETLANGPNSFPTKESSSSSIQPDASITTVEGSIKTPEQVDVSVKNSSTSLSTVGTLSNGRNSSSSKKSSSSSIPAGASTPNGKDRIASPDQVDVSVVLSTPESVSMDTDGLRTSVRKLSLRSASKSEKEAQRRAEEQRRIAAEKARNEKEAAEERARRAKEAEEERKRSGVRRIPLEKLIQPLSAEWENKVDLAMAKPLSSTLATTRTGTTLSRRDFGRVLPQPGGPPTDGWLNDEIINAYLEATVRYHLESTGHKRGETPTMHAFNTFFYTNLDTKGVNSVQRWAGKAKIGGKDLLKVRHVFIPVNVAGSHWTLLVVSPLFKTIEYFDSMHGSGNRAFKNAQAWLQATLKDDFVESEWKCLDKIGPRQNNVSDCGVFTSTTAKMVMLGVEPMSYNHTDIPTQRRRIVAELMNGGFEEDLAPQVKFAEV